MFNQFFEQIHIGKGGEKNEDRKVCFTNRNTNEKGGDQND